MPETNLPSRWDIEDILLIEQQVQRLVCASLPFQAAGLYWPRAGMDANQLPVGMEQWCLAAASRDQHWAVPDVLTEPQAQELPAVANMRSFVGLSLERGAVFWLLGLEPAELLSDQWQLLNDALSAMRLALKHQSLQVQYDGLTQQLREIEHKAACDGLTGLWNRSAIIEQLRRELARAQRSQRPVGLILLDLDHFKAINDQHGHVVGDDVLVETAQRLRSGLRQYDWVGRYGGEEFMVVLGDCAPEGVVRVANSIRDRLASQPIQHPDAGVLNVTASIGATISTLFEEPDPKTLLEHADQALYRAKNKGRDCVELELELA